MRTIGPKKYIGPMATGLVCDQAIINMPADYRPGFLERIRKYIIRGDGHWLWKGAFSGKYPVIGISYSHCPIIDGRARVVSFKGTVVAHRALYVIKYGAPEPGLEIDHTCSARTYCLKPTHLEAVTSEVNMARYFASPEYAARRERELKAARRRNEDDPELDELLMAIEAETG